jgi:hypothetical protein
MRKHRVARITNRLFLKSVDGPLKELVKFLHRKGIKTTPSCSGHHKSEKAFEKIYSSLEKDKVEIRNDGLKLQDIETGKFYLYQDENYILPWQRKVFLHKILSYQQKGVIGIITGKRGRMKRKILSLKIAGTKIQEKDSIIFIFTDEEKENGVKEVWKNVTMEIKKSLEEID